MTTTTEPTTHLDRHEQVARDIGDCRAAIHETIEQHGREMARLKRQAAELGGQQDGHGARLAMSQAADLQRKIDAARLDLRKLDDEFESLTRGTHPAVATALNQSRMHTLAAEQAEHTAALQAFGAVQLVEARQAAQRVIDAARTLGREPPALALALVQHLTA